MARTQQRLFSASASLGLSLIAASKSVSACGKIVVLGVELAAPIKRGDIVRIGAKLTAEVIDRRHVLARNFDRGRSDGGG